VTVAENVLKEIRTLTADLIEAGLCNDQNYPVLNKTAKARYEISFSGDDDLAITLKNIPYIDVYSELLINKSFNLFMLDGALVQLQYTILSGRVEKHRLAFFPSPDLSEYQNSPEIYETDEIYADVVMRNIVSSPIRFDFDRLAFVEDIHPMSHMTIGQYKNCRIPVGGPLSPYLFIHFILRAFYNTALRKCSDRLTRFKYTFEPTITPREQEHLHLLPPRLQ
jgi:hypothetical protein